MERASTGSEGREYSDKSVAYQVLTRRPNLQNTCQWSKVPPLLWDGDVFRGDTVVSTGNFGEQACHMALIKRSLAEY